MKKVNKQNGITLVALVITIIILLILAGISIQALTNTGIFTQAQKAKRESEIANIKEQIQLDIYEKQLQPPLGDITQEQLKAILEKYGTINYEEDGTTIKGITTEKGYEILLSEIYSGTTTETKTLLADKVNVGDYVTYTPDTASTTSILSELSTYSGNTDSTKNTASTLTQETGLKWRVLDVVDGKVRLISATPTTSTVTLFGAKWYNNAVYLLDKICRTLYSKIGYSEKVQSLKIEDIQDYLTYDYTQYENSNVDTGKYVGTKEYTNYKNYPNLFATEKTGWVDGIKGTGLDLSEQTTPLDATSTPAGTSIKVTQTYWYKSMTESDFTNPIYYNLFINNGSNYSVYWMSSRCVNAVSDNAFFCVRCVGSGNVDAGHLSNSNNNPISCDFALRPVITLNSNILVKSGEGSQTSPYEIGI